MANRKKHEKIKQQLNEVFQGEIKEKRGRKPLQKYKFPKELIEVQNFKEDRAGEAYMKLAAMSRDTKLRKTKPALYIDLQKWLWSVAFPDAKIFDPQTGFPIHVSFNLVGSPKEIVDPRLLAEAKITDIDVPNYESITARATDTTDSITTD